MELPKSILENFRDAVGINPHRLRFSKINKQPVILRRADISRLFESILRAIIQSNAERSKWFALHEILDFLNFHNKKILFIAIFAS